MLGLPVQMVWRLQTSLAQKIALTVTFMAGGSVVVASLYRIVKLPATTASDPLWSYTNATIWTSVEPSVGVVSACLPTMRPLLQYILSSRDRLESLAENAQDQARRHGIQLDSNPQKAHRAKALDKDNGINDGTNFQPNNNLPRKTAVTSGKLKPDPERDEMLLVGIHVQQDVQIDRTML
ncbi:hypothetical protein LPUS_04536 [Lasallia pustulata]|uniref:Rhodopsin domain-containing protein n=1 Tax=Lasallia pustulata TaxID=136370 RepID=A0A1W5CX04_9LECA|nr:hypothetical protein LPUS_04536 [Lasallia pustulata]